MHGDAVVMQVLTLLLLLVSEILPLTSGPSNGILHWIQLILKKITAAPVIPSPTVETHIPTQGIKRMFMRKV